MSISKENILSLTNQGLDVFRHSIDFSFQIGKAFSSPLRKDRHPSFSIFQERSSGVYLFKDFADDSIKGDAIRFIELLYNIPFIEALDKINRELSLQLGKERQVKKPVQIKQLELIPEEWNESNLSYFSQYRITKEVLVKFAVKPLKSIKYSNNAEAIKATKSNPQYLYSSDWGGKIYRPNCTSRFQYIGSKPKEYIFGYDKLPDTGLELIITGGEKDVLTFRSLGLWAICLNSETAVVDEGLLEKIRKRFKYILVCYDTDRTGIKAAENLAKKNSLINLVLPLNGSKKEKDISDFVRKGASRDSVLELINEAINKKFDEIIKALTPYTFDATQTVEKPIPILQIEEHNILSLGNLLVLAGKVKTGKSAVLYNIIAGAIRQDDFRYESLGITIEPNRESKAILHFDTEQSTYDWHKRIKNALRQAGVENQPEYFKSYHILEFTMAERLRVIQETVEYNYRKFGGIHLVLVDGVADLVSSVNDEEKSNQVVDLFHRLSVEYKCAIVLVVHLNPDGIKTRGHLGSQLDRKAESLIIIEREGDTCTINPKYCRNANAIDIPLLQFKWDSEKQCHVSSGKKSGADKEIMKIEEYKEVLNDIFYNGLESMDKRSFKDKLMEELGIKKSAVYNVINFMNSHGLITEEIESKQIVPTYFKDLLEVHDKEEQDDDLPF